MADSASSWTLSMAVLGRHWLVNRKSASWQALALTLPAGSGRSQPTALGKFKRWSAAATRELAVQRPGSVAGPEHNPSMLAETPLVLRELFYLIEYTDAVTSTA